MTAAKAQNIETKDSVVEMQDVTLHYGKTIALDHIDLKIPAGKMVGLIGPDGVGKSSLMSLIAGARIIQQGQINVLGGDMRDKGHRQIVCPQIAYMPQGLGRNLYPTLSVVENAQFFARLFGQGKEERQQRIESLLKGTGLNGFEDRPAGKLSGGMKQKLGLVCSLIHDPDLLLLDEPTTGVDPLSRRQFWDMIDSIRLTRDKMSVIVSTAYMEEAARFDWLVAMDDGKVLATGTPQELLDRTQTDNLDDAFIALLPQEKQQGHQWVVIAPRQHNGNEDIAIEAHDLTKRFGKFTAVDKVNFKIEKGEIFGFLGSNGCGKTTTMKMLTGLLQATEGEAFLFGKPVQADDLETRRQVGYMSQAFSLYSELSVVENLRLHAKLFALPPERIEKRIEDMLERFQLQQVRNAMPEALPLGLRQRLSLAVALIHEPQMLILDEPTSGVDPVARDSLWQILGELARQDNVTIFVSTHFMNEAERCDRISLMHAGKVLVSDSPQAIIEKRNADNLEQAFIAYLEDAIADENAAANQEKDGSKNEAPPTEQDVQTALGSLAQQQQNKDSAPKNKLFSPTRMLSYAWREALELRRDPIRATLALIGSLILMFVIGYGINMDIQNLSFAVLDHDRTNTSRDYIADIAGSRYFVEHDPLENYDELDQRMRNGELSLAIEIPPHFARDIAHGRSVAIGAWVDGAMPMRAETARSYVQGMHAHWIESRLREALGANAISGDYHIEVRFRYNPAIESLPAMVPAVIPLLLLMIPAMLAALSVVREKEMGSITNLYVTPVTRFEFLVGKQLPYIGLGMINCLLLWLAAIFIFQVPFTGSATAFLLAGLLYVSFATALGLLISTFMKSQIAAIFATTILTILPAVQFSGLIDPVSSLEGMGAFIGSIFPATYFIIISRGTFSKALEFSDLIGAFLPLLLAPPLLIALACFLTRKQER